MAKIRAKSLDGKSVAAAMQGRIKPVRTGVLYQVGLLLSSVLVLVLPVVYLALIGAVCYLVYWHAVNDVSVFEHVRGRAALVAYLGPMVVGAIVVGFMVKPLLARAVDDSVPLTLRREDEPVLFEFVDRLCFAVGSPAPVRIDVDLAVNASASFRGGWKGLLGRKLVLTFGLPLAAGLDARQFAGVLAHELGHFSQGSGMRLTYVVRGINGWFARVVYQRDQWDAGLAGAARQNHGAITVVCWAALAVVWLTRRVLWCLMLVAHGITAFLMRQMEYDADRHLCRVVGSDTFDGTFENIRLLDAATRVAMGDLASAWREKRLCDDLPALIRARHDDIPGDVRTALLAAGAGEKTALFDLHPSDAARSASAKREAAAGLFTVQAPATVLFKNFAELSRIATMLFYKRSLGAAFQPGHLAKTESLVEERVKVEQTFDALKGYCLGLIDPERPVFPQRLAQRPEPEVAAERLLELRTRLGELEADARSAVERFSKLAGRAELLAVVKEVRKAGIRKSGAKDESVDRLSDDALATEEAKCAREAAAALEIVEAALAVVMERMAVALAMAEPLPVAKTSELEEAEDYALAEEPSAGAEDLLYDALMAMRGAAGDVKALRRHLLIISVMVGRARASGNSKLVMEAIVDHARKAAGRLAGLQKRLGPTRYPYAQQDKNLTLATYVVKIVPRADQIGQVPQAGEGAVEAYTSLYVRVMSDLANRAQRVESQLGLPPVASGHVVAGQD